MVGVFRLRVSPGDSLPLSTHGLRAVVSVLQRPLLSPAGFSEGAVAAALSGWFRGFVLLNVLAHPEPRGPASLSRRVRSPVLTFHEVCKEYITAIATAILPICFVCRWREVSLHVVLTPGSWTEIPPLSSTP